MCIRDSTWTVEDCAGNVTTHTQEVIVADNVAPVLSALPADITVTCASDIPGDPGVTAMDNCGEAVTVMYSQSALGTCPGDDTVTNTWTVEDCAGNVTTHTQEVTVTDNVAPVLSAMPANIIVTCLSEVPGDPGITATDNCGEVLLVLFNQSALSACTGSGIVFNTWTVTDCAGNSTTHTQPVSYTHLTLPTIPLV